MRSAQRAVRWSWGVGATVVALSVSVSVAQTKPATAPADEAAVRATLVRLRDAAVGGDVDATAALFDTSDPKFKQAIDPMARLLVAVEGVKAAADRAYGPGTGQLTQSGLAGREQIDAAKVLVTGDRAVLNFDPDIGGPPDPIELIRVDSEWKLDARKFADEDDEDGTRAATMAMVLAWGVEDAIDEVEARQVDGANPVEFAMSRGMGMFTTPDPVDPAKMEAQLRAMQAERAPARQKWAAEQQAKRAVAAKEAKEAKKPAPAPLLPPDDQRDTPLEAARAFAEAVARGDAAAVAAMIEAPTPAARAYADAEAQRFIAQARYRRAVAERFGHEQALRLPLNDAGIDFVERYRAAVDGTLATVTWPDNFPTAENPQGTPRELRFVRDGAVWKLATVSDLRPGEARRTANELYDDAAGMREFARSLDQTIRDIEAGKFKSIEELRGRG